MSVLVVGRYNPEQFEPIRLALGRAGETPRLVADGASAREELGSGEPPSWLLVDASTVDLTSFVPWVRSEARLMGLLVVASTEHLSDHAFAEAFAAGCDDMITAGDLGAMTRRADNLRAYNAMVRPAASQGAAILAHPGDSGRRILGRTLRLAGFDVTFASTPAELAKAYEASPPTVMVVSDELEGGALASIQAARLGSETPGVVVAKEQGAEDWANSSLPATAAAAEHAPPDHLLFLVNELLRPNLSNLRSSRRVLWDVMCAFRPEGEHWPVFGFTYNLSCDGLYVRTLAPPERGQRVWIELRPPHSNQAVHLRGEVVWVRQVSEPGGIVPPGFGVKIDEAACPPQDLEQYRAAYDGLIADGMSTLSQYYGQTPVLPSPLERTP